MTEETRYTLAWRLCYISCSSLCVAGAPGSFRVAKFYDAELRASEKGRWRGGTSGTSRHGCLARDKLSVDIR